MKTSNKILLGIFLTILILTTVVQLMVYAKYKRGEFTAFKREEFTPMTYLPVSPARFISLKGMGNCAIKTSDTLKLEIQKDIARFVKYQTVNDTLFINDSRFTDYEMEKGTRNNGLVNIYLPAAAQLNGAYSTFRIYGTSDSTSAPSYTISLKNCYLFPDNASAYFNQLNVYSESSRIDLNRHAVFLNLNLQMTGSRLSDNSAVIRKLTMIGSDNNSSIELSGKNVNALK
ncbi:hypothetical protein A4H97_20485 [Niastella yeongjuensis]|uniref:Uncharacterized protein n=1 Tax=Niastella yeongjuensis TaxID=354355 RepID=A0A1V9FCG8_9BACT|nr:hypothetical protein [Niastella yeongjuensis]OQP55967.1 hypothetical protein A4H97_20485 [Niastella yeongjuensis]SEP26024.1 hypothetical protein SAMN05660816_04979 [Niastella yeongjuensis]